MRGTAGIPGQGDAAAPACGDNEGTMTYLATGQAWRRIAGSQNALALAGAVLALAAFGQAVAEGLTHTVNAASSGSAPYAIAL